MAGTLVSYLPFTRSVTEDLSGKEWTVTGNPQIITHVHSPSFVAAKFETGESITSPSLLFKNSVAFCLDFFIYIPNAGTMRQILDMPTSNGFISSIVALESGKLRLFYNIQDDFSGTTGWYKDTSKTYTNRWINLRLCFNTYYSPSIQLYINQYRDYDNIMREEEELFINLSSYRNDIQASIQLGNGCLFNKFRLYTGLYTYGDLLLPTSQSSTMTFDKSIEQEFLVTNTVYFESLASVNLKTYNKSLQWYYKNIGTADGLLVSGTSLTNLSPLKSVTSKAFYQTNRQKCFDTQASKEIYMLFDVYFDGTNRWRAYEESSTNGITGITAQTSGKLNIFSNGTDVGSISLTTNQLETYLVHMRSDATNGYIDVYKKSNLKNIGNKINLPFTDETGITDIFNNDWVFDNITVSDNKAWFDNSYLQLSNFNLGATDFTIRGSFSISSDYADDRTSRILQIATSGNALLGIRWLKRESKYIADLWINTSSPDLAEDSGKTINLSDTTEQQVKFEILYHYNISTITVYVNDKLIYELPVPVYKRLDCKIVIGNTEYKNQAFKGTIDYIEIYDNIATRDSNPVTENIYTQLYTYIGNVNNGDDFSNLELQSDGSGTIFSNIVISNQPVDDYDRWTGNYNTIQRTLTNETWVKEKCLKAGLPLNIVPSINISWTATGNVFTSSDIKKEGTSSIHLPNGAYLVANDIINLNTDKWTFDCWAYLVSSSDNNGYFALSAKTNGARYGIIVANDGIWVATTGGGSWQAKNENLLFPSVKNQWVHLAIVKNGSTVIFYQDGVSVWSFTTSALNNSGAFILGGNYYGYDTDIYFDEVRFLKDTALWTENFIPPTTEDYETYQNSLLSGSLDSTLNVLFPFDQIIPLSFTGQNDSYAKLPLSVLPGATTFTIEVKFSTTFTASYTDNYSWKTIIGCDIPQFWKDDFGLCINNGKLCFWAEPITGGSDSSKNTTSDAIVNDGRIHTAAIVSSNGAIDLYCDGQHVAHTDNVNAKITSTYQIGIASNINNPDSSLQMDFYEARLWNVARTQDQIFADIDGTETGLQGWYKPSQNSLLDYSGNNRHATIYNASYGLTDALKSKTLDSELKDLTGNIWTISGTAPTITTINELNGKATQFGQGYIYTTPPELKSNNFTIDFWEYIPSTVNGLTAQMVAIDGTDGTATQCLDIGYDNGATVPSFWLGKGTKSGWIYSNKIIGTKIRDQWVHRAVVRYNDKIYAFENGQLYTSFSIEPDMYIDINGSSLFVGGFKRASRLHPGMLSEVRVYVGTALWTENFTPPTQEDYFETYWYFNKPAPILNTNYNTLRYLTNNSKIWKYINPGYTDISPFTYTNISVTPAQTYDAYTDMQLSGNINLNIDIYQELCIKFNISIGNFLGTVFSFPYGKGTISISISKPESSTTYLAKIIHERNEENPIGTQLSPETSYSDYELGIENEEISFIIYIKSNASNKGEIIINSSAWVDTDNRRVAIFPSTERFHLYNANINEGNALLKTVNSQGIYNLIVSNQQLTFDDMVCQNINSTQRIVSNDDENWRREKYYYHTYLPFDDNATKDLSGDTWTLTNTLDIQNNACYFNGSGYLWKESHNLANKPFTVSFYMSATSNNTGKEPYIFQLYLARGFSVLQYRIGCKITTNGKLVFCRNFDDDTKNNFSLITPFSILDGKMHYIECIYTGSKCLFFVDGILIGTANAVIANYNYGLYLGKDPERAIFTGYLDEFRIYKDYVLHTENFTPPVYHQINDKLYYDKSAETMKFEYFVDVQKVTWKIAKTTSKKILVSYLPFDGDVKDLCDDERVIYREGSTPVFSSQDSTKNKSLSLSNYDGSSYGSRSYQAFFNLLPYDKSWKFIAELDIIANLPGDSFTAQSNHINILRISSGSTTIVNILYWDSENPLDLQGATSNVAKLFIGNERYFSNPPDTFIDDYTLTAQSKKSFHVTIIFDNDELNPSTMIFLKPLDGGNSYIYRLIGDNISRYNKDYSIYFGAVYNATNGLNINIDEFKFYLDYTDNTPTTIIDKNIEVRFNNGEESVYFEFYADIDLSKRMIINISPSILCWYYLQENRKLRIQGSQAFIPSNEFSSPKGVKDLEYYPSLEQCQFLEDSRTNSNIVYAMKSLFIPPQIDYLPYTLFFWLSSDCRIALDYEDTWALYQNSTHFTLDNVMNGTNITIAKNTTLSNVDIYHLALVLENSEASLYIDGSYVATISNLTFRSIDDGGWRLFPYYSEAPITLYGFGAIKGNIFKNGNVNLGYIGCPPSYAIGTRDSQVSKPRLALQHNDKTYYNKLVLPTDPNASSIRVYHNDTVYALSK